MCKEISNLLRGVKEVLDEFEENEGDELEKTGTGLNLAKLSVINGVMTMYGAKYEDIALHKIENGKIVVSDKVFLFYSPVEKCMELQNLFYCLLEELKVDKSKVTLICTLSKEEIEKIIEEEE